MQDLLGGIHDLDVLKAWITQESHGVGAESVASLHHTVETERRARIEQYRERTIGDTGLLREWKAGLLHGSAIRASTAARLHTSARAMDPHPHRTAEISRLAAAKHLLEIYLRCPILVECTGMVASGRAPRIVDCATRSGVGVVSSARRTPHMISRAGMHSLRQLSNRRQHDRSLEKRAS
jgi:hypothetical protein